MNAVSFIHVYTQTCNMKADAGIFMKRPVAMESGTGEENWRKI